MRCTDLMETTDKIKFHFYLGKYDISYGVDSLFNSRVDIIALWIHFNYEFLSITSITQVASEIGSRSERLGLQNKKVGIK